VRPIFVLKLEGKPGRHNIHALRIVLKALLSRHGLRCLRTVVVGAMRLVMTAIAPVHESHVPDGQIGDSPGATFVIQCISPALRCSVRA
jgi:hypothetical protein